MAREAEGRVAIVTGGTFGIGRAITCELARRRFRVVVMGLEERQIGSEAENGAAATRAALAAEQLSADIVEGDVSVVADVQRVVDFAIQRHGRLDVLVNNAAIHPRGTILDTPEDVWDRVIDVNLKGMFLACKAAIPHMAKQGGGAIVNIGSGSGWGKPDLLAYCASKGGVFGFSAALAHDHLKDHIRVNVVVPGGTDTGMTAVNEMAFGTEPTLRPREDVLQRMARNTVSGRANAPEDIAKAVAFLASDDASQISGAVLPVGCFNNQGGRG
jgi:NAD(P)-dependent dehydrogenase (short-subunit alcohol dehydrogenase family)